MRTRTQSWYERFSAKERDEADAFCYELIGEEQPWHEQTPAPPLWLPIARRLPVTFQRGRPPMTTPILGVVLHTTNHQAGADTLERFQADWQHLQNQSTTFMVDREGNIGQFRTTQQGSWHIRGPAPRWDFRYFGIEHIARVGQQLTHAQLERSARLIGDLSVLFGFPARPLPARGQTGIGIHIDFGGSYCGRNIFWQGPNRARTDTYLWLVRRAREYARWGF